MYILQGNMPQTVHQDRQILVFQKKPSHLGERLGI